MPLILRGIRKGKWNRNPDLGWLGEDEIQADAFGDLSTSGNKLSVWRIEDDQSNLKRIVAAISATKDRVSNLDYALIVQEYLLENGFRFDQTPGTTPDEGANSWHLDVVELTATKLVLLADVIHKQSEIIRIPEKTVRGLLIDGIRSGQFDETKLKESLMGNLKL